MLLDANLLDAPSHASCKVSHNKRPSKGPLPVTTYDTNLLLFFLEPTG